MTLTIKLDLDIIKVNLCTKFCDPMSNGSAVRVPTHWHTDRHTHKRVRFYNLDRVADAGGNKTCCSVASHPNSLAYWMSSYWECVLSRQIHIHACWFWTVAPLLRVCRWTCVHALREENPGWASFNTLKSIKSLNILGGSDKRCSIRKCFFWTVTFGSGNIWVQSIKIKFGPKFWCLQALKDVQSMIYFSECVPCWYPIPAAI